VTAAELKAELTKVLQDSGASHAAWIERDRELGERLAALEKSAQDRKRADAEAQIREHEAAIDQIRKGIKS
jgi:hypothetical protein